jgi:hypothetical protein
MTNDVVPTLIPACEPMEPMAKPPIMPIVQKYRTQRTRPILSRDVPIIQMGYARRRTVMRTIAAIMNHTVHIFHKRIHSQIPSKYGMPFQDLGFSLSEFKNRIENRSFLKTNLFMVRFTSPPGLGSYDGEMAFYGIRTQLPDVSMASLDVRRYGSGPIERMPFRPIFTDMPITYIVDGQGMSMDYLNRWHSGVVNYQGYNSIRDQSGTVLGSPSSVPYEVSYKSNFVTDVSIYVYSTVRDAILQYILRDAFLREIRTVQMNWGDSDQLMTVDTVFAYTDYTLESARLNIGMDASIMNNLLNVPQSVQDVINIVSSLQVF